MSNIYSELEELLSSLSLAGQTEEDVSKLLEPWPDTQPEPVQSQCSVDSSSAALRPDAMPFVPSFEVPVPVPVPLAPQLEPEAEPVPAPDASDDYIDLTTFVHAIIYTCEAETQTERNDGGSVSARGLFPVGDALIARVGGLESERDMLVNVIALGAHKQQNKRPASSNGVAPPSPQMQQQSVQLLVDHVNMTRDMWRQVFTTHRLCTETLGQIVWSTSETTGRTLPPSVTQKVADKQSEINQSLTRALEDLNSWRDVQLKLVHGKGHCTSKQPRFEFNKQSFNEQIATFKKTVIDAFAILCQEVNTNTNSNAVHVASASEVLSPAPDVASESESSSDNVEFGMPPPVANNNRLRQNNSFARTANPRGAVSKRGVTSARKNIGGSNSAITVPPSRLPVTSSPLATSSTAVPLSLATPTPSVVTSNGANDSNNNKQPFPASPVLNGGASGDKRMGAKSIDSAGSPLENSRRSSNDTSSATGDDHEHSKPNASTSASQSQQPQIQSAPPDGPSRPGSGSRSATAGMEKLKSQLSQQFPGRTEEQLGSLIQTRFMKMRSEKRPFTSVEDFLAECIQHGEQVFK